MSQRYKGAVISATPPTTTGGTTGAGSAPGAWTLQQQMQAQAAGAWPGVGNYIEDVFSTYLYTGNDSTQTITNGIDLAGKGGLVWNKIRNNAASHFLIDTVSSSNGNNYLSSDLTNQLDSSGYAAISFGSSGYTTVGFLQSLNSYTYASWTFRKQAKFFDVVTWTGNGANRTIAHNLGSVPGCIIVKRTDTTGAWAVYHRSLANTEYMVLNTTAAKATGATYWNSTTPTSTVFSLGTATDVNANGGTYVAYVFAHDAGGFGLTGADNVISCGSCSTSRVELGWEPQWILIKEGTSTTGFWWIVDNMRGMALNTQNWLNPNASDAESSANYLNIDATGFTPSGFSPTNIYIAIRRGPMKTPTSGTSVFTPVARNGVSGASTTITTTSFPVDMAWIKSRGGTVDWVDGDRLRGGLRTLFPSQTVAENTTFDAIQNFAVQNGYVLGAESAVNGNGNTFVDYRFRRAPGFFDEVCYTGNSASSGTGNTQLITHNLGVAPEMIIVKRRSGSADWIIWTSALSATQYMYLDAGSVLSANPTYYFGTTGPTPSATQFKVGDAYYTNASGSTYVAYLFASCPGVSKVGSYTGNGSSQFINCGFTGGARFVMVKAITAATEWFIFDTARGMTSGNDPILLLNLSDPEYTGFNLCDTTAGGFTIRYSGGFQGTNENGISYLFLAIA